MLKNCSPGCQLHFVTATLYEVIPFAEAITNHSEQIVISRSGAGAFAPQSAMIDFDGFYLKPDLAETIRMVQPNRGLPCRDAAIFLLTTRPSPTEALLIHEHFESHAGVSRG